MQVVKSQNSAPAALNLRRVGSVLNHRLAPAAWCVGLQEFTRALATPETRRGIARTQTTSLILSGLAICSDTRTVIAGNGRRRPCARNGRRGIHHRTAQMNLCATADTLQSTKKGVGGSITIPRSVVSTRTYSRRVYQGRPHGERREIITGCKIEGHDFAALAIRVHLIRWPLRRLRVASLSASRART